MLFGKRKQLLRRVLVVEDEPLIAFDTEHFLGSEGFEIVETVDSVHAAIASIDGAAPIDLVLVDVGLSDGSGVEVARAAHERGIEVLFVTGNCPGEARALAGGCLAKPYSQRDLLASIQAIESVIEGVPPRRLPDGFSLFRSAA